MFSVISTLVWPSRWERGVHRADTTFPGHPSGEQGSVSRMFRRARRYGLDVMVRKGGLEPPRPCGRQPLKLVEIVCVPELTRIHWTDVGHERARANAFDDFIRTHSHVRDRVL